MARDPNIPVHYRVSTTQAILLYTTGGLFYVIQLGLMLTIVGEVGTWVLGVIGDIVFGIWFFFLGANFLGGKQSAKAGKVFILNSLAELVPFLDGVYPAFIVEVWQILAIMKKEDEEKAAERAKKEGASVVQAQTQARAAQLHAMQVAQENQRAIEVAANDNVSSEGVREAA